MKTDCLSVGSPGTNCGEIQRNTNSFKTMHLKNAVSQNIAQFIQTLMYRLCYPRTKMTTALVFFREFTLRFQIIISVYELSSSLPWTKWPLYRRRLFKCIFMNLQCCILIRISLKFVPKGPIANNSALVKVMAWCRTGAKPSPEVILTQFTDAYIQH